MSDRIAAAKAVIEAAQKATPRPWFNKAIDGIAEVCASSGPPVVNWLGFDDSDRSKEAHAANAVYIVACCNHGPDLAALCLEQHARIERLEAGLRPFAECGKKAIEDEEPAHNLVSLVLRNCPTVVDCITAANLLAGSAPVATPQPTFQCGPATTKNFADVLEKRLRDDPALAKELDLEQRIADAIDFAVSSFPELCEPAAPVATPTFADGVRAAIAVVKGGRFLTDSSMEFRFAQAVAAALSALLKENHDAS